MKPELRSLLGLLAQLLSQLRNFLRHPRLFPRFRLRLSCGCPSLRNGIFIQAVFSSSYICMFSVRPLGSTGVTPLLRYYGPLRHPLGHSRLCIPAACWLCASQEGFPGSSADLSTRAAPNHPGRPGGCLPVASPPVSGFILVGGLATFVFLSRPNRVHLRCGSRVHPYQSFARWVTPSRACWATCPNRQFTW